MFKYASKALFQLSCIYYFHYINLMLLTKLRLIFI